MKRISRVLACALCAVLLAGVLPAGAATGSVRIVDSSHDFVSGYYVVYEYGGKQLRSDLLGANTNYKLWQLLPTADKQKVVRNYAFGPDWMTLQFGYDNAKAMSKWWNDDSGWAAAKKALEDRLAAREFPRVTACFEGSYQQRSTVALPEVGHPPEDKFGFLPAVRDYFALEEDMSQTWTLGQTAHKALVRAKSYQTSAAITSLSGDLISLICERALVPAITPGGLSALAPSFSGEMLGLMDKLTGLSDKVIETTAGRRLDASTARQIIDDCWAIIELNDQIANRCVDHFMELKGQKAAKYQEAADAINTYITANKALNDAAEQDAHDKAYVQVSPIVPYYSDLESLSEAYQSFLKSYGSWYKSVEKTQGELRESLNAILDGAFRYSGEWPWGNMDQVNPIRFDYFYGYHTISHDWNEDLSKDIPNLTRVLREMPNAFAQARTEAQNDIAALEAYIPAYEAAVSSAAASWQTYRAKFLGFQSAFARFGEEYEITVPSEGIEGVFLYDFYRDLGCSGFDQAVLNDWDTCAYEPLSRTLERMQAYLTCLSDKENEWNAGIQAVVSEIQTRYNAYKGVQDRYEVLLEQARAAKETIILTIDASDTMYYSSGAGELGAALAGETRQLMDEADLAGLQSLCDGLASDLETKWQTYEVNHTTWRGCVEEMEYLERKMEGIIGVNHINSPYNEYIDLLNMVGGGELKSPSYWTNLRLGIDNASLQEDATSEAEGVGVLDVNTDGLRRSYEEFTGENSIAALFNVYYDEALLQKPNYMRASASSRAQRAHDLKFNSSRYMSTDGAYNLYPITDFLYTYGANAIGPQKIAGLIAGWDAQLEKGYIPVTGLSGGPKLMSEGPDLLLQPGETADLSPGVTVSPADATDKTLIWESSDDAVCWVDENGVITAWQEGTATITVRAADSAWTVADGETVYDPAPLAWTVQVGSGKPPAVMRNRIVDWHNYGTEEAPRLYAARDNGNGTVTVRCGVGMMDTDLRIAVALYRSNGQLCDLACLSPAPDFSFQSAVLTGPAGDSLVLKAFALDADRDYAPRTEPLLNETVTLDLP